MDYRSGNLLPLSHALAGVRGIRTRSSDFAYTYRKRTRKRRRPNGSNRTVATETVDQVPETGLSVAMNVHIPLFLG